MTLEDSACNQRIRPFRCCDPLENVSQADRTSRQAARRTIASRDHFVATTETCPDATLRCRRSFSALARSPGRAAHPDQRPSAASAGPQLHRRPHPNAESPSSRSECTRHTTAMLQHAKPTLRQHRGAQHAENEFITARTHRLRQRTRPVGLTSQIWTSELEVFDCLAWTLRGQDRRPSSFWKIAQLDIDGGSSRKAFLRQAGMIRSWRGKRESACFTSRQAQLVRGMRRLRIDLGKLCPRQRLGLPRGARE